MNNLLLTKKDQLQTNIGFLFIGIWVCALIGFHKTYTIFFPSFKGFQWQQHLHGAMLMSWFAMLIIQPFLIRYGKNKTHRSLGKLGYALAPLVCYSIFLVTKMVYLREIKIRPQASVLAQLALDIPTIFIFGLFFILAMINRRNTPAHMRYMIGTSLLMIGPGLGRILLIFGGLSFPLSITIVYAVSEMIALLLLMNDFRMKVSIKPMATILAVLLINHILWIYQDSVWWQSLARSFVNTSF